MYRQQLGEPNLVNISDRFKSTACVTDIYSDTSGNFVVQNSKLKFLIKQGTVLDDLQVHSDIDDLLFGHTLV